MLSHIAQRVFCSPSCCALRCCGAVLDFSSRSSVLSQRNGSSFAQSVSCQRLAAHGLRKVLDKTNHETRGPLPTSVDLTRPSCQAPRAWLLRRHLGHPFCLLLPPHLQQRPSQSPTYPKHLPPLKRSNQTFPRPGRALQVSLLLRLHYHLRQRSHLLLQRESHAVSAAS